MPVVRVQHVGLPAFHFAQLLHEAQHASAEQDESSRVVAVTVNAVTIERGRDIEQIHGCFTVGHAPEPQLFGMLAHLHEGRRQRSLE